MSYLLLMTALVLQYGGTGNAWDSVREAAEADVRVGASETVLIWECPELIPLEVPLEGVVGYMAEGCSFAGDDGGILLPAAYLFFAVPPDSDCELEVFPEGARSLGRHQVANVEVSEEGMDVYTVAEPGSQPSEWGGIVHRGTFRRAGYAMVRLNPVILDGDGLMTARSLTVRLSYDGRTAPSPAGGTSGAIFDLLFEGGDRVWQSPPERQGPGPFWGLPWYRMEVDTAGMYSVECSEVPQAEGAPSASLALFCGMGREMGDAPWENAYTPRPVPILMLDGGDGTFDQGDSFIFFGRGLSWWEADGQSMPGHYGHRFDDANVYWLTWGGENGQRMAEQNGELTGAPAMPDTFLGRIHREQNTERCRGTAGFEDDWAWLRSTGGSDSWHYFDFEAPGATGDGYLRMRLASTTGIQHRVRVYLNSEFMADTSWSGTGFMDVFCGLEGIQPGGNSLALEIVRDYGSDELFMDWFQVFPWTGCTSSPVVQVPLEWWPEYERHSLDWGEGLEDALVFLVSGDTLARRVLPDDPRVFEFQVPADWEARELWIVGENGLLTPQAITYRTPGRIAGTVTGAGCVYIAADQFLDDIEPLSDRYGTLSFSASEVYEEFNGGVRDPGAIRALVSRMMASWDPIPADLVLVGGGTWDPRNFVFSKPSLIDVLYLGTTTIVSDDEFAVVDGMTAPQTAVSRIGVCNATDLQRVVQRSVEYRSGMNRGSWQTAVIGAADDERSPLHGSDERYHTQSVERLLTSWLPEILRPEKLYMIFYDWNSIWSKPEAREDYIDLWSEGALVSFYLGHGSFDQLADEGLLYLEDTDVLECGPRLPVAFFGSCDVGRFQDPSSECIGQQVTVSQSGGAIIGVAASDKTSGPMNETLIASIFDHLLVEPGVSVGTAILLGKLDAGYSTNNAQYVVFGDGSLPLAFPWDSFGMAADTMLAGEMNSLSGTGPEPGLLIVEAWESCIPDTYYTFRQSLPIGYLSIPGRYYYGTAAAQPDYSLEMFVPIDADTGRSARTQMVLLSDGGLSTASSYPGWLLRGDPGQDAQGPDIELWIEGYRYATRPEVSGEIVASAILSDSSGINLLGGVGRQLVLYVDGAPQDVSSLFQYDRGSSTTGSLSCNIGELEPGPHTLGLRAADGLLNISEEEIDITVTEDNSFMILEVFPYPNPCSDGTSINWTQTAPGTVGISVFTVAGRRVAAFGNIEGSAGYNQCWWDCRDADGDEVASGSYIFVVAPDMPGGDAGSSSVTGIIAVVRGQD
ncbi:MAG: hypothetical protein AVO35_11655 [Candidatus Aegiribacteria sp. MLS_C]|nr:MAG: hypothetical protein AVO35_11655 [Candidatus Aegiribacteria sp. MLS_C]